VKRRSPPGLSSLRARSTALLLAAAACALGRRYAGTYEVPTPGDGRTEAIEVAHLVAERLGVQLPMAEEASEDVFFVLRIEEGSPGEPTTVAIQWMPSEPERYTVVVRMHDAGDSPESQKVRRTVEEVLRARAGRWSYEVTER